MAKKGPKRPRPRPAPKPRPGYRSMLGWLFLDSLWLLWLYTATGCSEYVEQAIDCGDLAIHIADHLYLSENGLECGLGPETLGMVIDFGVACIAGDPDGEEALECLGALYALEECPETLPSECLLF